MPIFSNKFSPKKTPVRKNSNNTTLSETEDLFLDQRLIPLRLGDQQFLFEDGCWIPESGQNASSHKSNQKLKRKVQELQEEINMLQLKYEIVLNMLTETTAESQMQQKELSKLEKHRK